MKSRLLLVCVLSLIAPHLSEAGDGHVPFGDYLESFRKAHHLEEGNKLNDLLDKGYVVTQLGAFDLWYPKAFFKKTDYVKQYKSIAGAMLDMQIGWLNWVGDDSTKKKWSKNAKALHKWIRSWKFYRLPKKGEAGKRPDLKVLLNARPPIVEALDGFARMMTQGAYLGSAAEDKKSILVVFSPNREDFVGLGSFIGSLNQENKRILWTDGLAMWTSYKRGHIHVIGLEHPLSFPGKGDINLGMDMNAKEKTGMLQHIIQNSMELFLKHTYSNRLSPDLVNGLAMILVHEMYEENNVRAGGGSRGNSTAAFSKFVPGGASSGGTLPGRSAENRWRRNKGKGCFINALKVAQKDGARSAARGEDKTAFFALESDDGAYDYSVQAPFFFLVADRKPVPKEYVNDFQEFFRAYRCAFSYYLRNKAKADLLKTVLVEIGKNNTSFVKAVNKAYGMPFSARDGSSPSLEWRFLQWLSKGK